MACKPAMMSRVGMPWQRINCYTESGNDQVRNTYVWNVRLCRDIRLTVTLGLRV